MIFWCGERDCVNKITRQNAAKGFQVVLSARDQTKAGVGFHNKQTKICLQQNVQLACPYKKQDVRFHVHADGSFAL